MLSKFFSVLLALLFLFSNSVYAAIISEKDATRSEYDKVILRENGKPFFWNQVQVRHDTLGMV